MPIDLSWLTTPLYPLMHIIMAPKAVGPYSQAIAAGTTLYVSGQLPIDAATGLMAEGIEAQTQRALENISAILAEAGYALSDVVKTTVLLQDIGDFAAMNGVYATYFTGAKGGQGL